MIDTVGEGLRIFSGDFPVIQDLSLPPRKAFVVAFDNSKSFTDIGRVLGVIWLP
jgi:hypothetical protein